MELILLFISAAIINNFVLSYFLGICPFLGVSKKIDAAFSMGLAVIFVMSITAVISWLVNNLILIPFGLEILQYVVFILVIASLVQFVEMVIKKISPALFKALGIFLPLITTNCAILGLALNQTLKGYTLPQCIVYALGAGIGFTLALVLMAGSREENEIVDVPSTLKGAAMSFLIAGILSMAFMGFAGLFSGSA